MSINDFQSPDVKAELVDKAFVKICSEIRI